MQHAGLQYGQGAVNSHQSPPFAHADPQSNGGNTTSSLRQFRKKDDKNSSTDLNASVENIARVPPHNHYPARPNDYLRYQHQYPDYNTPYKETPAQVKYSEIAETPPQSIQHVDHLQKHKEVHKDFMDMCNISQQSHMKQNYADGLTRQQSYPPDAGSVHHQYLHKEPQVHPSYKPESHYQQYPQPPKYNMPSQCRKYPPPPPENDFLAKLQRINPSMARSIMSDHHIRESQSTYPQYPQNHQRYYPPAHLQNNLSYNYQYNYPSSCNYKHPEYPRTNQMNVGGTQYPAINPHADRSISPRNLHMMNYGTSPQKISPNYSQYTPEYAQHYQHRRASLPQEYYQQNCRTNPYMGGHQIPPETADNRGASGAIRHFLETWAEEEGSAEITPIFKDNIRIHNNETTNDQQVFVINPSELPQCLENVSLVPTENGQFILKTGALDNSVVRIKETTENNGERTVNVQIVEATSKPDCMMEEKTNEEPLVPYQENQNQNAKDCDVPTKNVQEEEKEKEPPEKTNEEPEKEEINPETSVIVSNEVSVIKDMPLIDEEQARNEEAKLRASEEQAENTEKDDKEIEETETNGDKEIFEETHITSSTRRTQRIFSVDDIINNIGSSPTETRRNSLQFVPKGTDEEEPDQDTKSEDPEEEMEYRNAISVEDDSVILEIGGAWVQLNINHQNGTKILSVLPLSDSLVIDVNGNYQGSRETDLPEDLVLSEEPTEENSAETLNEDVQSSVEEDLVQTPIEENSQNGEIEENLEEISANVYQSEVVIGEESIDNDVFLDFNIETKESDEEEETLAKLIEMGQQQQEQESEEVEEDKVNSCKRKRRESEDCPNSKKIQKTEEPIKKIEDASREKCGEIEDDSKKKVPECTELTPQIDDAKKKSEDTKLKKSEQKLGNDEDLKKKENTDEVLKLKKQDKSLSQCTELEMKKDSLEGAPKLKRIVSQLLQNADEEIKKKESFEQTKMKKQEKKLNSQASLVVGEEVKKKESAEETPKLKKEKKLSSQLSLNSEEDIKKKESVEETTRLKKQEKKLLSLSVDEEIKKKESLELKRPEKKSDEELKKISEDTVKVKKTLTEDKKETLEVAPKLKKPEKKIVPQLPVPVEEEIRKRETLEGVPKLKKSGEETVRMKKEKRLTSSASLPEEECFKDRKEEVPKPAKRERRSQSQKEDKERITKEKKLTLEKEEEEVKPKREKKSAPKIVEAEQKPEPEVEIVKEAIKSKEETHLDGHDVIQLAEELITLKQLEEIKEVDKLPTKAAKKLYINDTLTKDPKPKSEEPVKKKSVSKLEETVIKIKSMKERSVKEEGKVRKTSIKDSKSPKSSKKVTFNLETEVREISKEEIDRKRLSLEEYNSRKRKTFSEIEETRLKIMEDTVTSTEDINDKEVEMTIQSAPIPKAPSNWEADTPSPGSPTKDEVMSTTNRKCIIDVNEFNIKPIESVSTPSPVSSSQFSYHSEEDSLQVYKDVVDSKLNSLNIKIPMSKPKPMDRFSILLDRFLNKGSLNYEELEEVKKFIEIKRKMMEEEKKLTYEVRGERDYKDLKLHFRKVPEKRKKKRFRNLYAEDTSEDSDSSRSDKGVENYSVYQRDSQGVPKLIFKRKSGLPQPFVKLERSQAVELLAKKRKLY